MAQWCHSLGTSLRAGRTLVDALRATASRGHPRVRRISQTLLERLDEGDDLADALESQRERLPPLFVAMGHVASNTGHLPEVFRALEKYFRFQLQLRREFRAQIFWPVVQLVMAVFIVAGLIWLLGIVGSQRAEDRFDPLGFGLVGATGAFIWLSCCFGGVATLVIIYLLLRELLNNGRVVDGLVLRIPVLGKCLRTLALSRLGFAMNMTLDSGMSVRKALPLCFNATDNAALAALGPQVVTAIRAGDTMYSAFAAHPVFPDDFLEILSTAEEAGTIPESMGHLAERYNEEAQHQMAILNTLAGWLVWLTVAGMIVLIIFRLFLSYVRLLNSFLPK